jgi:hypothetical protein
MQVGVKQFSTFLPYLKNSCPRGKSLSGLGPSVFLSILGVLSLMGSDFPFVIFAQQESHQLVKLSEVFR